MNEIDIARLELVENFIWVICDKIMKQHIRDYH